MNKRILIVIILIAFTFGYAIIQSLLLDSKLASNTVVTNNSVLQKLPSVEMPVYKSDKKINLDELFKTDNIVVHFWASWCGPCEKEFPELVKLTKKLESKKNLTFLFVIVNDEAKNIDKFLKPFGELPKNVVLIHDNESIHQKNFGTFRLPETYIFGQKQGQIRRFTGEQEWMNDYYFNYLSSL